jgi:PhnB protein
MAVPPIPEGYHTLTPFLAIENAAEAIAFYERAFGARERYRMPGPDGTIAHAEIEIGDSLLMVSDPFPQAGVSPPSQINGTSVGMYLYVEDVDAWVKRAVDAGATLTVPVDDMFWGDRFGQVTDPYGHIWQVSTHVEDVPAEEMEERAAAAMTEMG